jgi:hypothetical protein
MAQGPFLLLRHLADQMRKRENSQNNQSGLYIHKSCPHLAQKSAQANKHALNDSVQRIKSRAAMYRCTGIDPPK